MKQWFPRHASPDLLYEDHLVYAALAAKPFVRGHVVVVWKRRVRDLHLLSRRQYEHLMDIVDLVRNAMLRVLRVKKVYLLYMDEANHVHWHLVPRYVEKKQGLEFLCALPRTASQDMRLSQALREQIRQHDLKNVGRKAHSKGNRRKR